MKRHRTLPKIAFLDTLFNNWLGFVVLFVLAFIQIIKIQEQSIPTVGEFMIKVEWGSKSDDDVDTYVMDPSGNIVYFQSRERGLMHLERDDLGKRNDLVTGSDGKITIVEKNEERVIIRGIVTGEYIVNVHMYRKSDPEPVEVFIALLKLKGADEEITKYSVVLYSDGDEETAFRFSLNQKGEVSNINHLKRAMTGVRGGSDE